MLARFVSFLTSNVIFIMIIVIVFISIVSHSFTGEKQSEFSYLNFNCLAMANLFER